MLSTTTYPRFLKFPAPREVDRYLYEIVKKAVKTGNSEFPAPREMDRYVYYGKWVPKIPGFTLFPAPLELDRYLYICQEFDCMDDF